jgi:hypothetical protein
MKKRKVVKYSKYDKDFEGIYPAKNKVPSWYKESNPNVDEKVVKRWGATHTMKKCVPFLESFTTGYVLTTPADILVVKDKQNNMINFDQGWKGAPLVGHRNNSDSPLPTPIGCDEHHFVWRLQSPFKLPEGYSVLFTHPLNRHDLPFVTLSGVIDADTTLHSGNIPFFLKEGFEGLIPAGTPYAQILPFKRENWVLEEDESVLEEAKHYDKISGMTFQNWYRNSVWKKKSYE